MKTYKLKDSQKKRSTGGHKKKLKARALKMEYYEENLKYFGYKDCLMSQQILTVR